MRVFLDTNVLAAGFATRGLCSDIIRDVLENHELVTSLEILIELKRILSKKFKLPTEAVEEALELIRISSVIATPAEGASYDIADQDDVPHISAAGESRCAFFVTGDKELWSISPVGKMQIVSPREFWEAIRQ